MKVFKTSAADMRLIGGRLCLDFVNTVDGRKSESPSRKSQSTNNLVLGDKLKNYSDLVAWSQHSNIVTATEASRLIQEGKRKATAATAVFDRAIALREALYRIFKAMMAGRMAQSVDLETVNAELLNARSHERLTRAVDGFIWKWIDKEAALDRMLWSIAHSAAELLTRGDLSRIRECGGEECGWLFEDISKNRSRQWCNMQDCGNLAKVRRYRSRLRSVNKTKR
jgi:predicted RNA-binding Zn ribbon-like protein